MFTLHNQIETKDVYLGIIRAEGVDVQTYPSDFEERLEKLVQDRQKPLDGDETALVADTRNMLRKGKYKPTGRGKPASEYLLRSVQKDGFTFPRINSPVDINNYISLKYLLPISLWDLDLAGTDQFSCRLGKPGEEYIFNQGGQTIDLQDLVLIARKEGDSSDFVPTANPVKDSLATKTTEESKRVGVAIFSPKAVFPHFSLIDACEEFACLLSLCGKEVDRACKVIGPGEKAEV